MNPPPPPLLGDTHVDLRAQFEFLTIYMSLKHKVRLSIGHQFADFIKECYFLGSDCLDIRYSFHPTSNIFFSYYFKAILKLWSVQLMELVSQSILTSLVGLHHYFDPHCPVQTLVSQSLWILNRLNICKRALQRAPGQGRDVSKSQSQFCWCPLF